MASVRLDGPLTAMVIRPGNADSAVLTEIQRQTIRYHLEGILQSSVFRNSKRYSGLLRYVVEETLSENGDHLKERTIGVEVFGRPADYDTTTDHAVRSAAGEVRKRLAQYYMECGTESLPRIELQAGSYVPQFRFPEAAVAPIREKVVASEEGSARHTSPRAALFPVRLSAIIAIAALPLLGFTFRSALSRPSAFEALWNPIFSSPSQALICVGGGSNPVATGSAAPMTLADFDRLPLRRMNVADAVALAGVAAVLKSNGKPYRILNRASATSFRDLQLGPFVLIGGMNNEWTLRLMTGLRFTFLGDGPGAYIADKQNPGSKTWSFSYALPYNQPSRDYAIVSRLRDPKTEQTAMIVAGIGSWGTQAAGEFVASPIHLKKLEAFAPRGWEQKNLQVVIATDVINGSSGPPIVVGTYFW